MQERNKVTFKLILKELILIFTICVFRIIKNKLLEWRGAC